MKTLYIVLLICFAYLTSIAQPDGSLDSNFGNNGAWISNSLITGGRKIITAIDHSQNIFVAGSYSSSFALIKLNSQGVQDLSFANNGVSLTNFGFETNDCQSMLIQTDDKIILGGFSYNTAPFGGGQSQISLIRLKNNGSVDSTFGINGKFIYNPYPNQFNAVAMGFQTDGKIIVVGEYFTSNTYLYAIRVTKEGLLDSTFSNNGVYIGYNDPIGPFEHVTSCAIKPNNKILIGYNSTLNNTIVFGFMCLTAEGSLDTGYGNSGLILTDIPGYNNDFANAIKIQGDQKIILAGSTNNGKMIAICRYNEDGSLDQTFGQNGMDTLNISSGNDVIYEFLLTEDGKILAAGRSNNHAFIIRLEAQGNIDSTFNQDGIIQYSQNGGDIFLDIKSVTPTKFIVAGALKDSLNQSMWSVVAYDFNLFSGIQDAGGMQEAASVYPNPSRNSIQFKQAPVSFSMNVYDLTGKLLAQKPMQANDSYDVSALQEGLYFIKLQTTEATQVIKFLKQ
jgi:uncharacterized delta-60 repeat protein